MMLKFGDMFVDTWWLGNFKLHVELGVVELALLDYM